MNDEIIFFKTKKKSEKVDIWDFAMLRCLLQPDCCVDETEFCIRVVGGHLEKNSHMYLRSHPWQEHIGILYPSLPNEK